MKKHINLISNQIKLETNKKYVFYLKFLRFINWLLLFVLLGIFLTYFIINKHYEEKIVLKEKLLLEAKNLSKNESKLKYLAYKLNYLKSVLKDDIYLNNFNATFLEQLNKFGINYQISDFNFDNNGKFFINITLLSYNDLVDFIDLIETNEFRKNFTSLIVNSFKIETNVELRTEKKFNLSLEGKLKQKKSLFN